MKTLALHKSTKTSTGLLTYNSLIVVPMLKNVCVTEEDKFT